MVRFVRSPLHARAGLGRRPAAEGPPRDGPESPAAVGRGPGDIGAPLGISPEDARHRCPMYAGARGLLGPPAWVGSPPGIFRACATPRADVAGAGPRRCRGDAAAPIGLRPRGSGASRVLHAPARRETPAGGGFPAGIPTPPGLPSATRAGPGDAGGIGIRSPRSSPRDPPRDRRRQGPPGRPGLPSGCRAGLKTPGGNQINQAGRGPGAGSGRTAPPHPRRAPPRDPRRAPGPSRARACARAGTRIGGAARPPAPGPRHPSDPGRLGADGPLSPPRRGRSTPGGGRV